MIVSRNRPVKLAFETAENGRIHHSIPKGLSFHQEHTHLSLEKGINTNYDYSRKGIAREEIRREIVPWNTFFILFLTEEHIFF
jgi:hypothetical protein